MSTFNLAVIGKGLIGSAAARYLSEENPSVAIIGPDEPQDTTTHRGVFASHYDQGRLTRLLARDAIWSQLAQRAIGMYPRLEAQSGLRFYFPVGALYVDARAEVSNYFKGVHELAQRRGLSCTLYGAEERGWQETFPFLDYPAGALVLHEPAPAGHINPRVMIQAQLKVAEAQGARLIREMVTGVSREKSGFLISTNAGAKYRAEQVLVAAGAFTNFNGLLPRPIPLRLKSETIILGEVSAAEAQRLQKLPIIVYQLDDPEINDIYMTPPTRYPDGRLYIKMGCNTASDRWFTTPAEIQEWFHHGNSDAHKAAMRRALHTQFPTTPFLSFTTQRCIVCYTPSGYPTIDALDEGLFVATGGNGRGAKCADTLGFLAAGLMLRDEWALGVPREGFRVGALRQAQGTD